MILLCSLSEEEVTGVPSEEEDGEGEGSEKVPKATLKPTGGFVWDTSQLKNELSSSEDEEEEDKMEEVCVCCCYRGGEEGV